MSKSSIKVFQETMADIKFGNYQGIHWQECATQVHSKEE